MMLLLHISLIALLSVAASEDCWWTGCQPNSWAVVGCAQYGRIERKRENCSDGFKYECCSVDSVVTAAPVTEDPLSCAGGYWTGCQPNSWAVVGCDHLNLTTAGKEPCDGGYLYRCCPKKGGDSTGGGEPDPPKPPEPEEEEDDPVTGDPLSCSGGYWTGCQPNSWAVVGCEHLNMTTKAKKPCEGGYEYRCCPRTGNEPSPDEDSPSASKIDPVTNMSYLNLVKYLLSKNEEFANPERISCTDIDPTKEFQLQIGDYAIPVCNLCPKLNQLIYVNKMMKLDPEWQAEGIDFPLCFGSCIEKVSCVAFSHDNSTSSCYHFSSSLAGMASVAGFNTVIMTQPSGIVGPWMYSRNTMVTGVSNDSVTASSLQDCIGKAESSDIPDVVAVSYSFQEKSCKLFSNTQTRVFSLEAGYASAMRLSSIISDSDTASRFDIADEDLLIDRISNYSSLLGTCNFTDDSKPFIGVYHRPQCKLNQLPGCLGDSPCKKCYFPEKLQKGDDPEGLEVCPDSFQSKYDKIMEKINKQLKECAATENCIAAVFDEFFNPEIIKPDNVDVIKEDSIVYIARYPKLSGSVLQRENFKILLSYKLQRSSVQSGNDFTTTRADTLGECMDSCNKMAGCEMLSFNDGSKSCAMSTADGLLFPVTTPGSQDVTAVKSKDASYTGTQYIFVPASTIADENAGEFLLDKKECNSKCVDFCQAQCDMKESCQVVSLTQTGSSFSCSLYSSGNLTMEDDDKSMIYRKSEKIDITENALNEMPAFSSSDVYGCYQDGGDDVRQTQNSLSFVDEDSDEESGEESKSRRRRGFFSAIGKFFKGIGKAVVNTAKGLVEGVKSVGQAVGDLVTGKPKKALERIKNVPIVGDVVKVGEGVGKLIKGDKKGALKSFEDTTIGNTINTAKDVATGLIKGDFDGAAEAAGGLAVDLVGARFGLKGAKGGKGGKGKKKGTVDNEIKKEKGKGDRTKRSTDNDKNAKAEKDQREQRKKECDAKKRTKRAAAKRRKKTPAKSKDDCDNDDDFCPAMKFSKLIKENKNALVCSRTKLSKSCKFECMPGLDEQPKYQPKCIKEGNDLVWERKDLRCEQEACPASGIIVLRTPHPTSLNERKVTAMVIKFDKSRKIPSWSVAMFQGKEFGPRDYTHLALEESAGRHGSFLKHHCPSLKSSQANDKSYKNQKWERGHLTPAQAVRWSPKASRSVNLYINVAPQDENVNKLIWKFVESHTYCFAEKTRTIVATGTCDKKIATMKGGVAVPSCFWKMICFRDENDKHQVVGFIADNSDLAAGDVKKRRKEAFTPKSQAEVLAHAGITRTPFFEAGKDIGIGREELVIMPGVDAIDTANPFECAKVMSLPKEIYDEWDNAMDPDEKNNAVTALKRKLSQMSIGSSSGSRRKRAAKGKRDCKPCNSAELKGTVGALITSFTEAKEKSPDEEIDSTESTVASGKCGKRVVGYYPSWGTRKFSPRMAQRLTHVIFAFFETTASGDVKIGCVDPLHSANCEDDAKLAGSRLKQMLSITSHFDHLNVMFAVGGWENSQYFSEIAASKEKRLVFIAAVIKAIREYNFDGVDVDWEYPVTGGAKEGVPSDKQNYVILLSELRAALDNLAKMDGRAKPFLLSIAGAAGQWTLDPGYDMKNLLKYLDFVNVMTYDFFGAWESKWGAYTGPPAPLYFGMPKGFSGKTNVAWAIKYYACRGQEPHKINMGVPFYGRYWENVGDPIDASDQMWRKANAVGGKFVGGAMKYSEVLGNISQPGFQQHFHEKTKSKYAFNPSSKVYIGFDDKETLGYKISFAQGKNVGGLMVWAIDQDDDDLTLLDLVAKADLCGNTNPKDINFKCLPTDEILWWIPENSDENTQGKCGPSAPPIHGRSPVCDPDDPGYSCCSKSGYCGSGDEFCKCEGCIDHGAEPDKILERSKITG